MTSWNFGDGDSSPSWGQQPSTQPTAPSTRTTPSAPPTEAPASPGLDDWGAPQEAPRASAGSQAGALWLIAGFVLAVIGIALHMVASSSTAAAMGWVLGGPAAIALLGVFIASDTRRQADPWAQRSAFLDWGRRLLVVVCLVAVTLNAWTIADHVSRGHW